MTKKSNEMSTLIFDIEADGLSADVSEVFCISIAKAFTDDEPLLFVGDDVPEGLELLSHSERIIGHNIINYDIPVLKKLYGFEYWGTTIDTLLLSRLIYPDIKEKDWNIYSSNNMPKNMVGSHSLKAWGVRLRLAKAEHEDFSEYSSQMGEYCSRDVEVTKKLFFHLRSKSPSDVSVMLEHEFASIIQEQHERGFCFDVAKAQQLYTTLAARRQEIKDQMVGTFPPKIVELKTKTKEIPFNPASRDQIANMLIQKYKWKPRLFTGTGKPQINELVLSELEYPEAKVLQEYLTINKRISQMAEGKTAWLKLERDGRLHGSVNTNGTVTGRCTHNRPNLAQVVSTRSLYGKECRELFVPSPGFVMCGVDASQLELRCLAHYMARFDGGKYRDLLLQEDIHTVNQEAAGLPTRDASKLFIYALIYGAGSAKIGQIIGGTAPMGQILKERFFRNIPALKQLIQAVRDKANRTGYLVGLDGRKLPVRSEHSALNLLLQSAGAVIMKQATVNMRILFDGELKRDEWHQVGHIHDEVQFEARPGVAEELGAYAVRGIRETSEILSLRCPLDGEYKIGTSWADTH